MCGIESKIDTDVFLQAHVVDDTSALYIFDYIIYIFFGLIYYLIKRKLKHDTRIEFEIDVLFEIIVYFIYLTF